MGKLTMISHNVLAWRKLYRVIVRPILLYGADCWPIKNSYIQKIHDGEIRMLRWSSLCDGQNERSKIVMVWT
ncbi:hypothetical protein H5410_000905 [Solanum commersonii]|uniref:Uncharacterized protein n=1 Tax=Solanum commersonii TaxID=4109 RepID=A0A9J6AXK2_SOLCO|nr:hypothetical protein H5410_000905 [Solanum commersonii]